MLEQNTQHGHKTPVVFSTSRCIYQAQLFLYLASQLTVLQSKAAASLCLTRVCLRRSSSKKTWLSCTVTDNVLELTIHENPRQLSTPSTQQLARRRAEGLRRRQTLPASQTQENLIGLGGRIYLTNVTLDGQRFSLVIDTGSSDTWVASTGFQCLDPNTYATLPTSQCAFGPFYNRAASTTFKPINHNFQVDYAGGEFLEGVMGTERFGIGGVSQGQSPYITINQTIGVVNDGYWTGDNISSGLMGLAYPALANGVNSQELNYTSVMYTMYVSHHPLLPTPPLTPP
jgi:hypothetical protein